MIHMKIVFSEHAIERCKQSKVSVGSLKREIQCVTNIQGKMRWMTRYGVLILERVSDNIIIVKTFIAKYKYKGTNYRKGCYTY